MIYFIGIDPGALGAIVVVDENGKCVISELAPRYLGVFDIRMAAKVLDPLGMGPFYGVIEKAATRRHKGQAPGYMDTGFMSLRRSISMWEAATGVPLHQIPARKWQAKVLGKFPTGESKRFSIDWCWRNAPDVDLVPGKKRVPQDGIADARCLAEYARVHLKRDIPPYHRKGKKVLK